MNLDELTEAEAAMGSRDFAEVIRRTDQIRCEQSLHEFVKDAWPVVETKSAFLDNWHIKVLCEQLEELFYSGQGVPRSEKLLRRAAGDPQPQKRRVRRRIINVPPGMMKSLIVMVFFPAWVWAKDPRQRFLCASYGAHLSTRDNLRCRLLIESEWYQSMWSVKLLEDQNTKTRYNTTENGWRISTSVGGPGTGEHPDFILIDDPHSAVQASSDEMRQAALDWFDNTISTRTGRSPAFIVIMQRLHTDDLTGHLLKKGGWEHTRWPMRFEKCECPRGYCDIDPQKRCPLHQADASWSPDPSDPREEAGELLHPAFKSEEDVRQLELDLGPIDAAGQLQQRPNAAGGSLFKRAWFKIVDQLPKHSVRRSCRGWDTASTEGKGDYTVGCKIEELFIWEQTTENRQVKKELKSLGFFITDVARDQLSPAKVDALIKACATSDGVKVAVREEREGGGSGKAVTLARATSLPGFDYEEVILGTNKVTRSKPLRTQVEAGNVYLLRAPWNEAFIVELCAFPTADHDDQVDAASCGFNGLIGLPIPKKTKITLMP